MYQYIFVKLPNITLNENPFSGILVLFHAELEGARCGRCAVALIAV
jgi:hypothetical protein